MREFKSGTIDEIFTEKVMYPQGKLTKPGSFYVNVTYYDYYGAHTEDAVLTFTGNSRSVRGGAGTFYITTASGNRITESELMDPNNPFADYLNDSIRVYNVPENNNGTASLSGLSSFSSGFSGRRGRVVQSVTKETSKISMKTILDETYDINNPDILYDRKIEVDNISTFSTFVESSGSASDSIISSIKEVDNTLKETNSDVFYTGSSAKAELAKINSLNDNTEEFKVRLGKLESSRLRNDVESYNDKFTRFKNKTRINLLMKRINEINNKNIVYSRTVETVRDNPGDRVYYEDKRFRVEERYTTKLQNLMVNFQNIQFPFLLFLYI